MEGGYTSAYELICRLQTEHPHLDWVDVPPQLQQLRGPYLLQAGLTAYEEHLGLLSPGQTRDRLAATSGTQRCGERRHADATGLKPPSGENSLPRLNRGPARGACAVPFGARRAGWQCPSGDQA